MIEISESLFNFYALALPAGFAFGDDIPNGAWVSEDRLSCGVLTQNQANRTFGVLVMRRREDDVWVVTRRELGFINNGRAMEVISRCLVSGVAPELIPPGVQRRPSLGDIEGVTVSKIFDGFRRPTHHAAFWVLNQLYLALPKPDPNWVRDCQTGNFHTRLWEAHLLACFREQGLRVTQDYPSPDFHVKNKYGGEAWIEAVTANPPTPYDHFGATPAPQPETRRERLIGPAAVRFAKTLKSKLDKRYDLLPHVSGKPFALALADFHAPGSMTWSRVALPSYLYGNEAKVVVIDGKEIAISEEIATLLGEQAIRAGLFRNDEHAELSAVLFSNACSISKLSRVAISAGAPANGYRYVRFGEFYDRTPGALKSIPFSLDVTSAEYKALWPPYHHEPWSAELEVFHNPFARYPIPDALFPEAAHWRIVDGEGVCSAFYEKSILRSRTWIMQDSSPVPTVDQLFGAADTEE